MGDWPELDKDLQASTLTNGLPPVDSTFKEWFYIEGYVVLTSVGLR